MIKWKPNFGEFPHKEGSNKLLWAAFDGLKPVIIISKLQDKKGTFAIDTNKGILVAKRYIYGFIVSAHKRAVIAAYNQGKRLIMYIESAKAYYEFDPIGIMVMGEENKRGNAIMLNWNIKLGKRFEP